MNDEQKKVYVNGEAKDPIRKKKVPGHIDWQALVVKKQKEIDARAKR